MGCKKSPGSGAYIARMACWELMVFTKKNEHTVIYKEKIKNMCRGKALGVR